MLRPTSVLFNPVEWARQKSSGSIKTSLMIHEEAKGQFHTFQGRDKQWWSNKRKFIFANEMVRPDKGDAGEIFIALFFESTGTSMAS